jgi:hypothetical protein
VTDEYKLRADVDRAMRAQQLIEDEILTEAFTELETTYIKGWRSTLALEDKAREKLWVAINVVGKVKEHLAKVVANGRLASAELNLLTQEAERKKRFGII